MYPFYAVSEDTDSPFPSTSVTPPTPATETADDVPYLDTSSYGISGSSKFVLITGGLGFIGSHTAVEVLKSGYNVIIVDDLTNSHIHVLNGIRELARRHYQELDLDKCPMVEFHQMQYQDIPAMQEVMEGHLLSSAKDKKHTNIAGVIHFAAYKTLHESICEPIKYYRNNITGLVDFLGLLDEYSIKTFIFSSSAVVYGSLAEHGLPLQERNCLQPCEEASEPDGVKRPTQSSCTEIISPYGRSKYLAEAILSDLVISDPSWNIVVLRYFNPVGCHPTGLLKEEPKSDMMNLLPMVTQVMMGQRDELVVYGTDWNTPDGTAIRDFIHVCDLARGHTAALSACWEGRLKGSYRTFNLGVGDGNSIKEVVQTMEKVSGRSIPWKAVGRRPGDVGYSVAAVHRARFELGWQTKHTLADACKDICHSLKIINA